MERRGEVYISHNHKAVEYKRLNLTARSDNDKWFVAIEIFRERIYGRYIYPIRELNRNAYENGFVTMAVCCLLIDTMYQFMHGSNETNNNAKKYIGFLRNNMSDLFATKKAAELFYQHIRCGILHSAQTKDGSILTTEGAKAIEILPSGERIKVNVILFTERLEQEIEKYINLLSNDEASYRENFVKKMNYIVNID